MKAAAIVARALMTLSGISLLLLGILFWLGHALTLIYLHVALGVLLVLCLWFVAALALRAGVSRGLVVPVLGWSLLMPAFGVLQPQLLLGQYHWLIRVLHLAVGVTAVGLGHMLAARVATHKVPATARDESRSASLAAPVVSIATALLRRTVHGAKYVPTQPERGRSR